MPVRGRGADWNPQGRFAPVALEWDNTEDEARERRTEFIPVKARTILSRNQCSDLPFNYSMNPYQGCEHGCIYCYARPSHEYWGFSAGLDFESRILIKREAPKLLRKAFEAPSWRPEPVILSGNTDPYQPLEAKLHLTRQCLAVFLQYRNPVSIITKNYRIVKDVDLLAALAERNLVRVMISITSLRDDLIGVMEPRTARSARRLKAIEKLTAAGVPVGAMVAPIIPGLTDEEMPRILQAAADHGAITAGYTILRLPKTVKPLFEDWIEKTFPERANKVLRRVHSLRDKQQHGSMTFGEYMHGKGIWAELIAKLFKTKRRQLHLDRPIPRLATHHFQRAKEQHQLSLF